MDFNKITAQLEFVGSSVHNVEINANMVKISNEVKKNFGLDIKCSKPLLKDNYKFGKLLMQIDVSLKTDSADVDPDTFKIVLEGVFKAPADLSDEQFMELLNLNGGAALFSIARSKVEVLSGLTYADGKIVLPMINIIQYFAERNTSQSQ